MSNISTQFKKGNKGKPKGAISKKTKDINEILDAIKNELFPEYIKQVRKLIESYDIDEQTEGRDRIEKIIEYVLPKQRRMETEQVGAITVIVNENVPK